MSALADRHARTGSRPPAYLPLVLATLPAQLSTGLVLWIVQLPFALLGIGPTSLGANIWVPWEPAGSWSALGLAAYVLIVCILGGAMAGARLADRGIARPAPAWAWLAFGASGYAAMALGETGGARLLLAIVLAPLTVRLLGYRVDGAPRPWPSRLAAGRRGLVAALLVAAVLALSYSATHAFAQNGSAGAESAALSPGETTVLNAGVDGIALPARVSGVQLDGRGAGRVAVVRAAAASEQGGPVAGRAAVVGPVAHALPVSLPARAGTWLAVGIRLLSCPARAVRIDAVTLRYRVLGIATSERIPLWSAERISCRGAAARAAAGD
jgi:hypothetical protein